jgi:predicted ArsR family transcriptional regulator
MAKAKRTRLKNIAEKVNSKSGEVVPKGWERLEDIAKQEGIKPETARKQLHMAVEAGFVECRQFLIYTGYQLRNVNHWRFKDER